MRRAAFGLLTTLLVGSLTACAEGAPVWVSELEAATKRAGGAGVPLRLSEVTDFEWDRAHVFEPYTTPEQISDGLGFRPDDETLEGPPHDGLRLVVFVADGEIVSSAEVSRCYPEFPHGERIRRGLEPPEAVFKLTKGDGHSVVSHCWAAAFGDE